MVPNRIIEFTRLLLGIYKHITYFLQEYNYDDYEYSKEDYPVDGLYEEEDPVDELYEEEETGNEKGFSNLFLQVSTS